MASLRNAEVLGRFGSIMLYESVFVLHAGVKSELYVSPVNFVSPPESIKPGHTILRLNKYLPDVAYRLVSRAE